MVFARGETQALVLATLGTSRDTQEMDGLSGGATSKSFILHYNFPPYSVGETGRFGFTGRREIGHGALAERSLLPVIPAEDEFPYAIRLVSEVMESNGSTSMASICGGCLALMDAGVPILAPVAGISAGLVTQPSEGGGFEKHVVLTDILGAEDHFGDMDFKIAGTREGVTGFQLDLKIQGLPFDIAREAIKQATEARLQILDSMEAELPQSRKELNKNAPRIHTMQIDPEKIGALIDLAVRIFDASPKLLVQTLISTTTTLVACAFTLKIKKLWLWPSARLNWLSVTLNPVRSTVALFVA